MYPGAHAATHPDKPAIVMAESGHVITYQELETRSAQLAFALHELGLRPGDVIAMVSDNAAECLELYWAALRSGLYLTAINYHLNAQEAAFIVADSDAKALIASAAVGDLAKQIAQELPSLGLRYSFGGEVDGFGAYADLLASAGASRLKAMPRGSDMLYSSGTTGRPKGVKPPLLPIQVNEPGDPLTGLAASLGFTADDVYLSPAPIYHAAPLRWCGVVHAHGGTVVVMEKFDALKALELISTQRVTVTQMVPTMFVRLLQLGEERLGFDVSTLRLAMHAAAPCPQDVKEQMIDWWGPRLVEYYSSTEANGLTLITSPEWMQRRGSVGRSMLGPVHICDDEGIELPVGEPGTVYFERERRPFEYHKDPVKTKDAEHPVHRNWTTVGDVGYVDDAGYLYLTDRKSFMILSGGVNVYPQEAENALTLHPLVYDVAVIGVPHDVMGEEVKAVVQLKPGVEPSAALADELIAYTRERIAHFKAPRSVDFGDTLPRTSTGKRGKRLLKARYEPQAVAR